MMPQTHLGKLRNQNENSAPSISTRLQQVLLNIHYTNQQLVYSISALIFILACNSNLQRSHYNLHLDNIITIKDKLNKYLHNNYNQSKLSKKSTKLWYPDMQANSHHNDVMIHSFPCAHDFFLCVCCSTTILCVLHYTKTLFYEPISSTVHSTTLIFPNYRHNFICNDIYLNEFIV